MTEPRHVEERAIVFDRIKGRIWAQEVLAALADESDAYREGFWRRVKKEIPVEQLADGAMSLAESREYGRQVIDFGTAQLGKRYDDAPLDWIAYIVGKNEKLRKYYLSRRVQDELAGDDPVDTPGDGEGDL